MLQMRISVIVLINVGKVNLSNNLSRLQLLSTANARCIKTLKPWNALRRRFSCCMQGQSRVVSIYIHIEKKMDRKKCFVTRGRGKKARPLEKRARCADYTYLYLGIIYIYIYIYVQYMYMHTKSLGQLFFFYFVFSVNFFRGKQRQPECRDHMCTHSHTHNLAKGAIDRGMRKGWGQVIRASEGASTHRIALPDYRLEQKKTITPFTVWIVSQGDNLFVRNFLWEPPKTFYEKKLILIKRTTIDHIYIYYNLIYI